MLNAVRKMNDGMAYWPQPCSWAYGSLGSRWLETRKPMTCGLTCTVHVTLVLCFCCFHFCILVLSHQQQKNAPISITCDRYRRAQLHIEENATKTPITSTLAFTISETVPSCDAFQKNQIQRNRFLNPQVRVNWFVFGFSSLYINFKLPYIYISPFWIPVLSCNWPTLTYLIFTFHVASKIELEPIKSIWAKWISLSKKQAWFRSPILCQSNFIRVVLCCQYLFTFCIFCFWNPNCQTPESVKQDSQKSRKHPFEIHSNFSFKQVHPTPTPHSQNVRVVSFTRN